MYVEPETPDQELEEFETLQRHLLAEFEAEESGHPLMRLFRLPLGILDALGRQANGPAIALARAAGYGSENDLTNIIFYFRHPEAIGRRIQPHETELKRSWLEIRDTIVRPALKPAAVPASTPRSGTISAANLTWYGPGSATPELMAFMRAVFERHMSTSKGTFVDTLPASALGPIEGDFVAKKEAADAAKRLLGAARAELAAAGPADRIRIGLTSAYRSAWRQFEIWQGKGRKGGGGFPYYYAESAAARQSFGDPHGPQAVAHLTALMRKFIAAPGYSNHQDGLALDLGTGRAKSGGLRRIKKSDWFHGWLTDNAHRFGFEAYPAEAWHWVYRGPSAHEHEDESEIEEFEGDEQEGRLID